MSPHKVADLRVKELELLQGVIARLATYGATLKNYCITLTTAVAGFALTLHVPAATLLALLPISICALLDAQYLRNERRFRRLFHVVRAEDWTVPPVFNIGLDAAPQEAYRAAFASWSIAGFYGPLAAAVLVVCILTGYTYGRLL